MNTLSNVAMLKQTRARDNVILLEELEFVMPTEQLQTITDLHNDGMELEDIAKEVKRNQYEVLIALIHQNKRNVKLRPFAYRDRG
ncbi:hypothetical protein QGM71_01095 [Virgibacillus sp. C22-A2]|uniref:Uncharacterized protein n=1 Tax=Virgibacillus tibetensis TaxID=3042313 RepID=A0ABU6KAH1_9BACI|nr:hypothetical protein [Virgibacillus sp. C22-A2]